jgi:Flp pilus assembly protein TadG
MSRARQAGTTTVEFAVVGLVTLVLLFVIVEFGRILFSINVLDESARRGARLAAVCPVGDATIAAAATFVTLPNLTAGNILTEYLDGNGTVLGDPANADYPSIEFVRVRIVNYSFPVAIPLIATVFAAPEVSSILPRESLGVPKFGVAPSC